MKLGAAVAKRQKTSESIRQVNMGNMAPTTIVANIIRRAGRSAKEGAGHLLLVTRMVNEGRTSREIYQSGMEEGRLMAVDNLADVLYAVQYSGLGRASVVEESRSHIVLRLHDFKGFGTEFEDYHCDFVAGFIAGALMASNKYDRLRVSRMKDDKRLDQTCLFRANLRISS